MGKICVFCEKIGGMIDGDDGVEVVSFEPLNPVTDGHQLVVPVKHVEDVSEDPKTSALVMDAAAMLSKAWDDCNIITSKGTHATQTIRHLHLHIVPRRENDGLKLPWSEQQVSDVVVSSPDTTTESVKSAIRGEDNQESPKPGDKENT